MKYRELPVPSHFDPDKTGKVWKINYQELAEKAEKWAKLHNLRHSADDPFRICLVAIDLQNTFCIPGFELFVGGRSGKAAVDDNVNFCKFIYKNINAITEICPTMDTHQAMQIFHPIYLINNEGTHPSPFTLISLEDIINGVWKFNPALCRSLRISEEYGQRHLFHYVEKLKKAGKYNLTIWPYHAMLGGIGHALASSVEEAVFFHGIARYSRPDFLVKGDRPFTEHYSVLGPEVMEGPDGNSIGDKSSKFLEKLMEFDAVVIAGQAKSHCVSWTIYDLLHDILSRDRKLVEKVYLLNDCTSPVVIQGVIDYTENADNAFREFADMGMHIVRSTDPIENWPGIKL